MAHTNRKKVILKYRDRKEVEKLSMNIADATCGVIGEWSCVLWSSMQEERGDRGGKVDARWKLIVWARFACRLGISAWWCPSHVATWKD